MGKNFFGSRILKTGVAVFLTAYICNLLGWSPVFAVITAIVTIEPTIADSVRKGLIRFPASAIGSAFAVLSISLFGNSPVTYTLAAVLTIAVCSRLKLYDGLLVATITSVAMIEVTSSSLVMAFIIRLGTTSIGLFVSTVVNMLIFPPSYRENITTNITKVAKNTGDILLDSFDNLLDKNKKMGRKNQEQLSALQNEILQIEQFIHFERDELKYHFFGKNNKRDIVLARQQTDALRRILDHIDNLRDVVILNDVWNANEIKIIQAAVDSIVTKLQDRSVEQIASLDETKTYLTELLWKSNSFIMSEENTEQTAFPPEFIMMYELIAIIEEMTLYMKAKNI